MAVLTVSDFSGSNNQNVAPNLIANNQSPISINCTQDQGGNVAHRLGSDLYGAAASETSTCKGLGTYNKSDGTHTMFKVDNGNLYYDNAGTWTLATGGSSLFAAGSTVEFANFLDRMYMIGSGATEYLKYVTSGTSGVTTVSGNIKGSHLAVGNGRLFSSGGDIGAALPRRAYYSNVNSDTFTTASDYIDLDEPETGIISLGESNPFLLFSAVAMYVVDPNADYSRRHDGFGCTSHRSIKVVQGHAVWLGREGIYRFNPTEGFPMKISTPIENEVTYQAIFNQITGTGFSSAAAGVVRNKYFLSLDDLSSTVLGETLNDCWVVFDIKQLTFSVRTYTTNGAGAVFTRWIDGSGDEHLMCGSRDDEAIYKIDVDSLYTDDTNDGTATAVTATFNTKHFEFSGGQGGSYTGVEAVKTLQSSYLKITADTALTIEYAKDGETTYSTWTTTGTTGAGYYWHREEIRQFNENSLNSISVRISGTGNWILHDLGMDVLSKAGTELQVI